MRVKFFTLVLSAFLALGHCAAAFAAPGMISPLDGSTLSGSSETFTWSADGTTLDKWRLEVGTVPDGGDLFVAGFASSVTSVLISGLPTDGSSIYVNLKWRINGVVSVASYIYVAGSALPDTELPVVTITEPTNGAIVGGLVTVTATATDNDNVTEVEFFAAGSSIGIDTTEPYSAVWASTVEVDADYDITVVGRDPSGNEGSDSVVITLDNAAAVNEPPVVDAGADRQISLPTDTVSLIGTVIDDGLPNGSLTTNWTAINPPFPVSFFDATAIATNATFAVAGTYILRLTADDGALSASADVTITVNPDSGSSMQTFVTSGDSLINGLKSASNFGSNVDVVVHNFGPKVGLVQFDLSSLSGATVSNASLQFRLNRLKAGGNIDIQLPSEAWTELGVTFDSQPAFGATVLTVPVTTADVGTVVSVDVTSIVQSWADGSEPNHGFRLATSQSINAAIDSLESAGAPMELLVTTGNAVPVAATPAFTPNGGTFTDSVEVTLTTATPDAMIFYTLDGSDPDSGTGSTEYLVPFGLTETTTVRARAFAAGFDPSSIAEAVFSKGIPVNNPPVLAAIGPMNVTVGEILEFQVSATDVDATTPSVAASNLPGTETTATFTPAGAVGTFSWTPTAGDVGTYTTVTFTAIDQNDAALTDSEVITITVSNSTGGGTEQTLSAIEDTLINGLKPANNFGDDGDVVIHNFGPKIGFVQFDLSSVSGATVSAAIFRFRLNRLKAGGNIDLQLPSAAWSESTVTFDNQPAFGATVLTVPVTTADVGTVVSVDVTGIVQSWADGSQDNHGFRLATSQGINAAIDSSESSGTPMELLVTVGVGTPIVQMPSISPNGAISSTPVEVTLATPTVGAAIYYTLDGSTPTAASNSYSAPFSLPASATIKARAFASGLTDSVVNSADFAIDVSTGGDLNNYWSLNEGAAGSYANDVGPTAGACSNCPVPTTGLIGGAQSFDGTGNVITIPDDGSADWIQNGGFTAEFWMNKSSSCAAREVALGRYDGGAPMQWAVGCDSGLAFFELVDRNGTSVTVTGSSAVDDGRWHHVVAVYDGFFNENRLYVDGNLEASGSAVYASGFDSAADVTIGELQNGLFDTFWHGTVDEVALHDRAIPVSMINRHYLDGTIGLRDGYLGCSAPVKIMPLGDSNTDRLGYRPTLYFSLTDHGYDMNFVGSQSDNASTGSHDRDHEGHSGFTTTDIVLSLNGWLTGNPPQVILLHIGTNDIGTVSVAEAITGLTSILDTIHSFDPNITVVLGQIINRQTFSLDTEKFNDDMATLAQTKLMEGYKVLLVDHENALIYPDDMLDLEHANDSGYAKMAEVWFDGVTNFLPACRTAAPIFQSDAIVSGQVAFEYLYQPGVLAYPNARFTGLTLPAGMQVHPDTGEIRWVPGSAGQYNIDLQIQNSAGSQVQSFILNIP